MKYTLSINKPKPYFAEIPYYLWGAVNYGSDGDCSHPTSQEWTYLELTNRDTGEILKIDDNNSTLTIEAESPIISKVVMFLKDRCVADAEKAAVDISNWNHEKALNRANRVATEFSSPILEYFDSNVFWGSWKWIGGFATDCTIVGRLIMCSLLTNDIRGVKLCIDWLRDGTWNEKQSIALRYALSILAGQSFKKDKKWVKWYYGSFFKNGEISHFPEPDIDKWIEEINTTYISIENESFMKSEIQKLKDEVRNGLDVNDVVSRLHQLSYTIVESIKFVCEEYSISLGDAKTIVVSNHLWAAEVEAADKMHEELIAILNNEDDIEIGY